MQLTGDFGEALSHPVTLGVVLGLVLGKPIGEGPELLATAKPGILSASAAAAVVGTILVRSATKR